MNKEIELFIKNAIARENKRINGKFIVIEGLNRKLVTSVAKELAELVLPSENIKAIYTKEPTDNYDEYLGKIEGFDHPEIFAFMLDRQNHDFKIKDWLKEGFTVVCDRYSWSMLVYGDWSDERSRQVFLNIYKELLTPDLIIYIDSAEESEESQKYQLIINEQTRHNSDKLLLLPQHSDPKAIALSVLLNL